MCATDMARYIILSHSLSSFGCFRPNSCSAERSHFSHPMPRVRPMGGYFCHPEQWKMQDEHRLLVERVVKRRHVALSEAKPPNCNTRRKMNTNHVLLNRPPPPPPPDFTNWFHAFFARSLVAGCWPIKCVATEKRPSVRLRPQVFF